MAAVTFVPQNLPTKIKSTVLYNCCIKVLANKGNKNTKIPFPIGHFASFFLPIIKMTSYIMIF